MRTSAFARTTCAAAVCVATLCCGGGALADHQPTTLEWADSLRHVEVNGAELAVLDLGKGQPIVFVHGSSADYRTWLGEIGPLVRDYRVIAYSRRYHWPNTGGGDGTDYSAALHERDLAALIDTLGLGKVILVGHSYGANVAARLAADHPEMVRSLVLAEPMFPELMRGTPRASDFDSERQTVNARVIQSLRSDFYDLAFSAIADWVFGDGAAGSIPRAVRPQIAENVRTLKLQYLSTAKTTAFGCTQIQQIRCPVLYVDGARSPWHAHAMADAFVKCRPSTRRATLRNVSHGLVWDDPKAFAHAMTEFLDHEALAQE